MRDENESTSPCYALWNPRLAMRPDGGWVNNVCAAHRATYQAQWEREGFDVRAGAVGADPCFVCARAQHDPWPDYVIREAETAEDEIRLWYVSRAEDDTIEAGPFESPQHCAEWIAWQREP